ncbi:hypothetical protein SAMN05216376_105191 [Mameliella alba]|uniref:head-tail joining protein n=1 Tax=Mameliella alba TaxID=561184 RepID=UPI00087E299A|nr:hypothetical protein [Mameliella alba]OWV48241.1 hypothetical protein CDZ96_10515 [Mameliella alba]PTR40282.1 hypothetical protein LX94_01764 [Mameliella alba]GGF43712.1 hypothetical protein GCM10011319_01910 [Mameliella alba]SDC98067.1 hypothetical protein SAMN05216376_105191 [Mameliella alba]
MTFAADASAIFDGPLGVDATYTPAWAGPPDPEPEDLAIRVMPDLSDSQDGFGAGTFVSASAGFWVLVSDVAAPVAGDTITVDGATYTVQGEPVRDERRLKWRIEARPA